MEPFTSKDIATALVSARKHVATASVNFAMVSKDTRRHDVAEGGV